ESDHSRQSRSPATERRRIVSPTKIEHRPSSTDLVAFLNAGIQVGAHVVPLSPRAPLRLQILGPLRIWRHNAELDAGPRQQAYLLALLLARAGHPLSVDSLIDLIWDGDVVPASALNVIHKYVGALRRVLEPELPPRGASSYLQRRGDSYVLVAEP